ncbi:DNA cytosine methyltransferase [Superficieibacter electus]|uniref:DNA cytosine methyltransferase n=1 Tax=Superficieibacter electus TaxID=2022662 RepID=A0A2P5GSS6_9ENTR|nr:DNA cytosine methyltransferase [Superficieibacter electus]POP46883.1 DNA cytosine methyltransferase [Superficieibacter electus]POP49620.1 DNA cytosine methyltransferase [Superficieibacter electus]
MTPAAYYNEIDPYAAQWLRNLIAGGHIAPGEVDERSIEDVTPDDLRGFTQCHFFAGIGVWSHSLRLAGWPDDKPVWTGSCPCQPFSAAGKGDGFADERHLWPAFFHLISECRPQHVFGEQVAAGNANVWFDLVQTDMEGMEYAFGLVPFPAAGIGAPNIRERAFWVAHADMQCESTTGNTARATESSRSGEAVWMADASSERCKRIDTLLQREEPRWNAESMPETAGIGSVSGMGNSDISGLEGLCGDDCAAGRERQTGPASTPGIHDRLAYSDGGFISEKRQQCNGEYGQSQENGGFVRRRFEGFRGQCESPSSSSLEVNGFWRDADWLLCRDGKWRPVEPGTFPLVDGAAARLGRVESGVARVASSNRVGRLKGYGNAINAQAAAHFIYSYMQTQD